MPESQASQPELPAGAVPIDTDELLAAIGELYVQTRLLRRMVAQQQQPRAPNGLVDAVPKQ